MMDEYISRVMLLEHLDRCKRSEDATTLTAAVVTAIECFVRNQPAADVVPVVRCKYCVYLGAPLSGGYYDCKKYMLPYCSPDDFCSYGERRGGGNDNVSD